MKKRVYFASDFHLGSPTPEKSREREKRIVLWLNEIEKDASHLYLVGDIFDFWFDYKHVVPKGSVRFLGKLAELADQGIEIHIFTGNHDVWYFDYFQDEIGATLHRKPYTAEHEGKVFYIAHGDGLGPGDHGYKFIKKIFTNPFCQWLFKWLHPDLGYKLANFFSHKSRSTAPANEADFLGERKERIVVHSKELDKTGKFDFFIYGHRHHSVKYALDNSLYFNLGDWINKFTYAAFNGHEMELYRFNDDGSSSALPFTEKSA